MKNGFRNFLKSAFSWYFSRKAMPYWCVLLADCTIVVVSMLVAHVINYGFLTTATNFGHLFIAMVIYLICYLVAFRIFKTYTGVVRYSSFIDLFNLVLAVVTGSALVEFLRVVFHSDTLVHAAISAHDLFVGSIIAIFLMSLMRMMIKLMYDYVFVAKSAPKIMVFGTRSAGMAIAKSIRTSNPSPYQVEGFITDDPKVVGYKLMNLPVVYALDETKLHSFIATRNITAILVSPLVQDFFVNKCQEMIDYLIKHNVKIKMMAQEQEWDGNSEALTHKSLKDVSVEALLPRDKIEVDMNAIGEMLHAKRILITGAAGSIGSEMVRQVAKFGPAEMVLVDQAETPMHDIRLMMKNQFPNVAAETIVGSIGNQTQMEELFRAHRPEYVFHAAAYKHVPMMEDNPAMAIQNNVYGTRVIADLAVKYGTRKFVMISTDKAVNPTNVMGCSKRICEIYCQSLNAEIAKLQSQHDYSTPCTPCQGDLSPLRGPQLCQVDGSAPVTQFVTTRFGNVLGSNGSVIPIFEKQIKKGGPVTVTHPDIIRYFMLIPEACRLVLEAGTMGKGGEIFVFDMGEPVRIADLAQRMIDMMGADDVKITYTGLRDGEKLYEEVLSKGEDDKPTVHPKIKVAAVREYPYAEALRNEKELYELSFSYDDMAIVAKMKEIVPEYRSKHSKYEVLDK